MSVAVRDLVRGLMTSTSSWLTPARSYSAPATAATREPAGACATGVGSMREGDRWVAGGRPRRPVVAGRPDLAGVDGGVDIRGGTGGYRNRRGGAMRGGYGAGKGEGSGGRRWPHRRWREAGRRGSGATVVEEDGDEASSPCRGGGRSPAGRRTGTRRRRGSVRRGQLRAAAVR